MTSPRNGTAVVWRLEMRKLSQQWRVTVAACVCMLAPLVLAALLALQQATPSDTLFGQWVHLSGWAVPMVVLGWSGQWALPALSALVAGDIFSSEDHNRTWKMVSHPLTNPGDNCSRASFWRPSPTRLVIVVLLAVSGVVAAPVSGPSPLVGLSGQIVPGKESFWLVLASWVTQIPPLLAFVGLAILLSVWSRNSVVGIGGPVVVGLCLQVASLISMPVTVRTALPTTAFQAWTGFWTEPRFVGPLTMGLVTSMFWSALFLSLSWVIFRRRNIQVR